ncbi:MAG: cupin domain-containing protein [Naasia sp.]
MDTVTDGGTPLYERRTVEGELIETLPRPALAETLDLLPHPEGGWYRRTWTSPARVAVDTPAGGAARPAATLILFLLPPGEASAWHKVVSSEIWIWNGPDPVRLQFGGDGDSPIDGEIVTLGDARAGHLPQAVVDGGVWQRTLPGDGESLVSCMVSPGFDFADFTLAQT